MRYYLCFLMILLFSSFSSAHDKCDRDLISKAIQETKNSPEVKILLKTPREKTNRPARKTLLKVFHKVEKAVFGRQVLRIQEELPIVPPMASMNSASGTVTIHPQTLDSLNSKLARPPDGAAFIIAHEIAHFVQDVSFHHSEKKLSPNGFKNVNPTGNDDEFNQLHAETDCIAVEILHQAGYPITDDIFKTLQIIKEECKTQRDEKFCAAADEVRRSTVQSYIQRYYSSHPKNAEADSGLQSPPQPKSESNSKGAR